MPIKKKVLQVEKAEGDELTSQAEAKELTGNLRTVLDNIKTREGVIGYILRTSTSATVDIKDPSKIIDYAVLSASALESAESLSHAFRMGKLSNVVVEGKDLKILLLTSGDHRISVFMEKSVNHTAIYKEMT